MSTMDLPVRYYRYHVDLDKPNDERHLEFHYTTFPLPVAETAFVLVDCWNGHQVDGWIERAGVVMRERVVPALHAARQVGLTVVHAPSPEVAMRYPQSVCYADDYDLRLAERPGSEYGWPPREFRDRVGRYQVFSKKHELRPLSRPEPVTAINDLVDPRDDEFVVRTGRQLRRLLVHKRILHLVYVGFAANHCLQFRDYGMREQANYHGYNCIVLRDCTMALESADTVDEELHLRVAIREIEGAVGWSSTGEDFIKACQACLQGSGTEDETSRQLHPGAV